MLVLRLGRSIEVSFSVNEELRRPDDLMRVVGFDANLEHGSRQGEGWQGFLTLQSVVRCVWSERDSLPECDEEWLELFKRAALRTMV